jgi:formylglycine-generating enzyme required for sulfatase activity
VGSEGFYPEERPVHEVAVDGFWMDAAGVRWFPECAGITVVGYRWSRRLHSRGPVS